MWNSNARAYLGPTLLGFSRSIAQTTTAGRRSLANPRRRQITHKMRKNHINCSLATTTPWHTDLIAHRIRDGGRCVGIRAANHGDFERGVPTFAPGRVGSRQASGVWIHKYVLSHRSPRQQCQLIPGTCCRMPDFRFPDARIRHACLELQRNHPVPANENRMVE